MKCPLAHDTLVDYWSGALANDEATAVDEHLFTCNACFDAAGKVAALASAVREALAPVVTEADVARARAQGVLMGENDFLPGEVKEAWMRRGVDVLIHRLLLPDPKGMQYARVEFEALDGTPLFAFPEGPVDPSGAVLVACQRHFTRDLVHPDMRIRLRGTTPDGERVEQTYTVLHRFE